MSGWWNVMRKRKDSEVFQISGARKSLDEDVRGRQRRYAISMIIRTLSVIAAALLWNVERYVAIVALVLGTLIPYFAVVIANVGRENASSLPATFIPAPNRPAILPGENQVEGVTEADEPGDTGRP